MKDFNLELKKIHTRLLSGENFSFSKYADGEWAFMQGKDVANGEFAYENRIYENQFYRDKLLESFTYRDPGYYIGVSCPCCQGMDTHLEMIEKSGQDDDHLTFANVFVNSNYREYVKFFMEEYRRRNVHLVAHKSSDTENLPFHVEKFYPVGRSAHKQNYSLISQIKEANIKDALFLFACGPFGNMLAHQLWEDNKNNTYLDIGSTLNPWLKSEAFARDYYVGGYFAGKQCVWSNGEEPN